MVQRYGILLEYAREKQKFVPLWRGGIITFAVEFKTKHNLLDAGHRACINTITTMTYDTFEKASELKKEIDLWKSRLSEHQYLIDCWKVDYDPWPRKPTLWLYYEGKSIKEIPPMFNVTSKEEAIAFLQDDDELIRQKLKGLEEEFSQL